MAQLPPKIPSMTQNWPNSFPHQRLATFIMPTSTPPTPTATSTSPATAQHGWADEFLDFASARRGAHRRSISDSIAFLESPLVNMAMEDQEEEYRRGNNNNNFSMHGFERLDDEQLIMSMFCDDMSAAVAAAAASGPPTLSSSNPSSPSDQNSNNDEKQTLMALQYQQPKTEPGEVESPPEGDDPHAPPPPLSAEAASGDTIIDPKRVKRILANRQSAQRSRVRKLQYISELERSVTTLQSEVSALSPRVAFLDHQRLILNVDNSALKQRIAALAQENIFKDAHQEALKKEIERLRQVYHRQNLNKMGNQNTQPPPSTAVQQNSDDIAMGCTDEERIPN